MTDKRINEIKELLEYQKNIRKKSDPKRWEAFAYVQHRIPSQSVADDCPIEEMAHLYDSTGVDSFESFVAGFMGAFMSPTQEWFSFRLDPKNKYDSIEPDYGHVFTDYLRKSIKDEFDHSNFYSDNYIASKDSLCGGYSCTMVQFNPDSDRCNYMTLMPWRCYFGKDTNGNWNQFFYEYPINGVELLNRFPDLSTESKAYKTAVRSGVKAKFRMLLAIIERSAVTPRSAFSRKFSRNKKYASIEICLDSNEILYEGGYDEFPVTIHIWSESGDSHYGEGLAMKYLAELRKLQRLGYEYGLSIAKINHHGWLVPDTMYDSFSNDPEARIKYQSKELIPMPLEEQQDLQKALDALNDQRQTVRHLFHYELFNFFLQNDKVYTATQVNQVKADSLSVLAPVYGNIQQQKIDSQIFRTMAIMVRNKKIVIDSNYIGKKAPYRIKVILDSSMAQQLSTYSQVNSATSILEMLQVLIAMNITDAKDNVNIDNLLRGYMIGVGSPAQYFVSVNERDGIRQQRQELARQQMELQNELTASEINRNNAGASNLNNVSGFNGGIN